MHFLFAASIIDRTIQFFDHGGFFMYFLLLLSIVAVAVMILRGLAIREKHALPPALVQAVERLEPGGDLSHLEETIRRHPSPLGRILGTITRNVSWPRQQAMETVQTRARYEIARLESGLVILEIATGVAPLLGLLGTLSGLIHIFGAVGADPVAVARGISEALNATIAGLGVAVPCLITFNYYQRRVEVLAIEMESIVGDLLTKCYPIKADAPAPLSFEP